MSIWQDLGVGIYFARQQLEFLFKRQYLTNNNIKNYKL